jgi:hypothetical protein
MKAEIFARVAHNCQLRDDKQAVHGARGRFIETHRPAFGDFYVAKRGRRNADAIEGDAAAAPLAAAAAAAAGAADQSFLLPLLQQPQSIVGGELKPYQVDGVNFLRRLHANGVGGILGDEMGCECRCSDVICLLRVSHDANTLCTLLVSASHF